MFCRCSLTFLNKWLHCPLRQRLRLSSGWNTLLTRNSYSCPPWTTEPVTHTHKHTYITVKMLATVCLHTWLNANGQKASLPAIHAAESEHQPAPGGCPVIMLSVPRALLVHPPAISAYRSVSYEAIQEAGGSVPWLQSPAICLPSSECWSGG